jgi:hypothetical protein
MQKSCQWHACGASPARVRVSMYCAHVSMCCAHQEVVRRGGVVIHWLTDYRMPHVVNFGIDDACHVNVTGTNGKQCDTLSILLL